MKYIMFSSVFPAHHPRKGQPTHFMAKIHKAINANNMAEFLKCEPKYHTIRAGNRWKVGDVFSARIWDGKPYRSKQIEFAQLEVKKIWPFTVKPHPVHGFVIHIKDSYVADWEGTANITQEEVAENDGLTKEDFLAWFKCDKQKPVHFSGQIICWNNKINY